MADTNKKEKEFLSDFVRRHGNGAVLLESLSFQLTQVVKLAGHALNLNPERDFDKIIARLKTLEAPTPPSLTRKSDATTEQS